MIELKMNSLKYFQGRIIPETIGNPWCDFQYLKKQILGCLSPTMVTFFRGSDSFNTTWSFLNSWILALYLKRRNWTD